MSKRIKIEIGSLLLDAELEETPLGMALHAALPVECPFETTTTELYFSLSLRLPVGDASPLPLALGDISYRPDGAISICLGPEALPGLLVGRVIENAAGLLTQAGEILIRFEAE